MTVMTVSKGDKVEAMIVPIEEYKSMEAAVRIVEDMEDDLEIVKILKERVFDRKEPVEHISNEELLENLRKKGFDV